MIDELFSLRILIASRSRDLKVLVRQAASASTVPIEIVEADEAASAGRSMESGVNIALLDVELGADSLAQVIGAARGAAKQAFTVLLCPQGASVAFQTDALATKPEGPEETARLLAGLARARMPSRVMVVDDSATVRGIVRKMLEATRFPLEITEVEKGGDAIELARRAEFDVIFLDYNMPGLSGLETIVEFRRHARKQLTFVLMTSSQDETIAMRARAKGAMFLKKPFFPADIESVLCRFYGLRALKARRAN